MISAPGEAAQRFGVHEQDDSFERAGIRLCELTEQNGVIIQIEKAQCAKVENGLAQLFSELRGLNIHQAGRIADHDNLSVGPGAARVDLMNQNCAVDIERGSGPGQKVERLGSVHDCGEKRHDDDQGRNQSEHILPGKIVSVAAHLELKVNEWHFVPFPK